MSNRGVIFTPGLNHKRASSNEVHHSVLFARRASPCSPLPTLSGDASAVLASSTGEACSFRFFKNNSSDPDLKCIFVRIDKYQS